MSVTFSIEALHVGGYDLLAYDDDASDFVVVERIEGDYIAAQAAFVAHMASTGCDRMDLSIQAVMDVDDALDVDLANGNFRLVAGHLGLAVDEDGEYVGSEDGEAFLARCLVATVGATPARETVVTGGDSHATWIDCGLSASDVDSRVERLITLAREAARLGRSVVWS